MKFFTLFLSVFALVLSGQFVFAEVEPNDLQSQATSISLQASDSGTLGIADQDWYTVTIPDDGSLTFTVNTQNGNQVNNLQLFDIHGLVVTGTWGTTATVSYANLAKGQYYLSIRPYTGSGDYTVENSFVPALYASDLSTNDVVDDAQDMPVNDSITGRLYYKDTTYFDAVDWYKITIPDNGRLSVNLYAESTLQVNNIKLYDVNKTSIIATGSWGNSASLTSPNILAGTYYLKIPEYTGYGSYYILNSFSVADLLNDSEPNDRVQDAMPFGINDSVTGQIYFLQGSVYDAVDWYSVTIPDDGRLSFYTYAEAGLQINNLKIYDKDSTTLIITGSEWGDTSSVVYNNLTSGTYFLEVREYTGSGSYVVKNVFEPATYLGDVENNDLVENAVELGLNDTLTGRLYYRDTVGFDAVDWYKITIPDDGSLFCKTNAEQTLQINNLKIYDKDTTTLIITGSEWGDTATVIFPNLTAGTYFLKAPQYAGYGSYEVLNQFIPATFVADEENNNIAENAVQLPVNDTLTGRLYYRDVATYDAIDWYKITIPDDGQLKILTYAEATMQINNLKIYDKDTSTLIITGSEWGDTASVVYNNLTSGTYFVRVAEYTGYGSYIIESQFTAATYPTDNFNNNIADSAQVILAQDSITGRLYYRDTTGFDSFDWYMVVLPDYGNLSVKVSAESTLQVNNLVLYAKNKTTILKSGTWGNTASVDLVKTKEDTIYIKVPQYTGYGSYSLTTNFLSRPTADFELFQSLNDIAATNASKLATTYVWDFGDGNTSTEAYAKHTYTSPGTFNIQLFAENAAGIDTAEAVIEIEGIRDFNPKHGGNIGDVTLIISGGGFRSDTKCWIEKSGVKISPDTTILVEQGVIRGMFDMREKEIGEYDVFVQLANGTIFSMPASFTLEEGKKADPWVAIVGRDKILFNRWQTYTINYGNAGNVDATGVPLWILLPRGEGIEVDFVDLDISLPISDDPIWQLMADSIPLYMDIDMFKGEPFEGRLYPLFIPSIPAGETYSLRFKIKTPHDIEMQAWVSPPFFQSPINPDYVSCIRWAQATALANGLVGIVNTQLPGVACANSVLQTLYDLKYAKDKAVSSHLYQVSRAIISCASEFVGPLKAYQISIAVFELGLDVYDNYDAVNECQKKHPDPEDPSKLKKPPFDDEPLNKKKPRAVSSFDPNEIVGPRGYTDKNYVKSDMNFSYSIYFENKATATAPATEVLVVDTLDAQVYDFNSFNFTFINFGDTTIFIPQGGKEFTTEIDLRPALPSVLRINAKFDTITGIATWHYITLDTLYFDVNEDPDAGFLPPNITAPQGEGIVAFSVKLKQSVTEQMVISNKATIVFDSNPPIYTNTYSNEIDETLPVTYMHTIFLLDHNNGVYPLSWEAIDNESGVSSYTLMVSENDGTYETILGATKSTDYEFIANPGSNYKFICLAIDSVGNAEQFPKSFDLQIDVPLSVEKPVVKGDSFIVNPNPVVDNATVYFTTQRVADVSLRVVSVSGTVMYQKDMKSLDEGTHSELIDFSTFAKGMYVVEITSGKQTRTESVLKIF